MPGIFFSNGARIQGINDARHPVLSGMVACRDFDIFAGEVFAADFGEEPVTEGTTPPCVWRSTVFKQPSGVSDDVPIRYVVKLHPGQLNEQQQSEGSNPQLVLRPRCVRYVSGKPPEDKSAAPSWQATVLVAGETVPFDDKTSPTEYVAQIILNSPADASPVAPYDHPREGSLANGIVQSALSELGLEGCSSLSPGDTACIKAGRILSVSYHDDRYFLGIADTSSGAGWLVCLRIVNNQFTLEGPPHKAKVRPTGIVVYPHDDGLHLLYAGHNISDHLLVFASGIRGQGGFSDDKQITIPVNDIRGGGASLCLDGDHLYVSGHVRGDGSGTNGIFHSPIDLESPQSLQSVALSGFNEHPDFYRPFGIATVR